MQVLMKELLQRAGEDADDDVQPQGRCFFL
jgi:hypothetical protein